jgi:hypothetical protein
LDAYSSSKTNGGDGHWVAFCKRRAPAKIAEPDASKLLSAERGKDDAMVTTPVRAPLVDAKGERGTTAPRVYRRGIPAQKNFVIAPSLGSRLR